MQYVKIQYRRDRVHLRNGHLKSGRLGGEGSEGSQTRAYGVGWHFWRWRHKCSYLSMKNRSWEVNTQTENGKQKVWHLKRLSRQELTWQQVFYYVNAGISEMQVKELAFLSLNEEMEIHRSKPWWRENNQRDTVSNKPDAVRREENISTKISKNQNSRPRWNRTPLGH